MLHTLAAFVILIGPAAASGARLQRPPHTPSKDASWKENPQTYKVVISNNLIISAGAIGRKFPAKNPALKTAGRCAAGSSVCSICGLLSSLTLIPVLAMLLAGNAPARLKAQCKQCPKLPAFSDRRTCNFDSSEKADAQPYNVIVRSHPILFSVAAGRITPARPVSGTSGFRSLVSSRLSFPRLLNSLPWIPMLAFLLLGSTPAHGSTFETQFKAFSQGLSFAGLPCHAFSCYYTHFSEARGHSTNLRFRPDLDQFWTALRNASRSGLAPRSSTRIAQSVPMKSIIRRSKQFVARYLAFGEGNMVRNIWVSNSSWDACNSSSRQLTR